MSGLNESIDSWAVLWYNGSMEINLNTWIVSDTHFGHNRIVELCNRPPNHDEIMLGNWKDTVGDNETILHLGDLGLRHGKPEHLRKSVSELPGKKYMIWGNHDEGSEAFYNDLGFEMLDDFIVNWNLTSHDDLGDIVDNVNILFSHYPRVDLYIPANWINIHGHIHNNGYPPEAEIKVDYRNVSIERMAYGPVRLRDILMGKRYESPGETAINDYEKNRYKNNTQYDVYKFLKGRETWRKAKDVVGSTA